jgi:hypothetical protein
MNIALQIKIIREQFCGGSNKEFAEFMGENVNTTSNWVNSDNIGINVVEKIIAKFPSVDPGWLLTGNGSMLRPGTAVTHGKNSPAVSAGVISGGVFGGVVKGNADSVTGDKHETHHHNGGKDIAIDELQNKDRQMLQTLIDQLDRFHHVGERRDDYVQKQDEWITRIIKQSYLRNKENMERIDKMYEQQSVVLGQQNKLIELIVEQNKKTQDRADRLLTLLENKLN